ncbi:hypothetical protein AAC387_Pa05g1042 [Persea americana]
MRRSPWIRPLSLFAHSPLSDLLSPSPPSPSPLRPLPVPYIPSHHHPPSPSSHRTPLSPPHLPLHSRSLAAPISLSFSLLHQLHLPTQHHHSIAPCTYHHPLHLCAHLPDDHLISQNPSPVTHHSNSISTPIILYPTHLLQAPFSSQQNTDHSL